MVSINAEEAKKIAKEVNAINKDIVVENYIKKIGEEIICAAENGEYEITILEEEETCPYSSKIRESVFNELRVEGFEIVTIQGGAKISWKD